jgi:hypothetical protein
MSFNTPTATVQLTATPSPTPVPTNAPVCLPPAVLFQGLINCNSHFQYLGFYNWTDKGNLLSDNMDKYRYFSLNTPVYGHVIVKARGDGTYIVVESAGGYTNNYPIGKVGQMTDNGVVGVLTSNGGGCWLQTYLSGATIENNSTLYYETTGRRYKMWNYDPTTSGIASVQGAENINNISFSIDETVGRCQINPDLANITNTYDSDARLQINGFVNDDLLIDGVIYEDGIYPYYDVYGGGCGGGVGINGQHNFTYVDILTSGQTVRIGCVDNGGGGGRLQAVVALTPLSVYQMN